MFRVQKIWPLPTWLYLTYYNSAKWTFRLHLNRPSCNLIPTLKPVVLCSRFWHTNCTSSFGSQFKCHLFRQSKVSSQSLSCKTFYFIHGINCCVFSYSCICLPAHPSLPPTTLFIVYYVHHCILCFAQKLVHIQCSINKC